MPEVAVTANAFARLWALGYRTIVPVIPPGAKLSESSIIHQRLIKTGKDTRGKTPGVCNAFGEYHSFYWNGDKKPTEADMARYAAMGAGLGFVCTPESRLVGIDVDSLDQARSNFMLGELKRRFPFVGDLVPLRYGKRPKFLTMMRVAGDEEIAYRRVEITCDDGSQERAELLCAGRYFNWNAIHPGTLKPYEHTGELPRFEDLPLVPLADIDAFFRDIAAKLPNALYVAGKKTKTPGTPVAAGRLKGRKEDVQRAVRALPNDAATFPHYDDYIEVGYAIKAASQDWPEEGEDLWIEWSDRWDNGSSRAAAIDWQTLNNPRIGAGWLNEKVLALTGKPPAFDTIAEADTKAAPPAPVAPLELVAFHAAADRALTVSSHPLVKRLLDSSALSVFYGPSGQFKTFMVMDLALHVALGRPWAGHAVPRARPVLYVAGEGSVGANKRAAALRQAYGIPRDLEVPFFFRMSSLDLLRPDADLRALIATIKSIPDLGLVVLDTLSRAMAGGDENASTDMGAMVRHLDMIRAETGAHVLAVHHTGKDVAKGARGHSLLRAATDTEVEINEGVFAVTKQREIETTLSLAFAPKVVELGLDADGERITSVVMQIVPAEAAALLPEPVVTPGEASAHEAPVLRAIADAAATAPNAAYAATLEEVLDRLKADGHTMTYEGLRTHLRRLRDKHLIEQKGRGKWVLTELKSGQTDLTAFDRFDRLHPVYVTTESQAVKSGQESGQDVFQ